MTLAAGKPPVVSPDPAAVDQRIVLHGVTWEQYRAVLAARGESGRVRITLLHGELELMTPSRFHERLKTKLARLVEAWAEESGTPLEGYGSWTLEEERDDLAAEPDECYVVGEPPDEEWSDDDRPDFAIEVVWTSGGLPKLEVYRGLGVREVWFWEDGELRFFVRRRGRFERSARSRALPELDPLLVAGAMERPSQTRAVRWLRERMRARRKRGGERPA